MALAKQNSIIVIHLLGLFEFFGRFSKSKEMSAVILAVFQ